MPEASSSTGAAASQRPRQGVPSTVPVASQHIDSHSYSMGPQVALESIGPAADCRQYAYGHNDPFDFSVTPPGGFSREAVDGLGLADTRPIRLHHMCTADQFARSLIPAQATVLAYRHSLGVQHYARIHRDERGSVIALSQSVAVTNAGDASSTARVFDARFGLIAQRGMSAPQRLDSLAGFVGYCEQNWNPPGTPGYGVYYFARNATASERA